MLRITIGTDEPLLFDDDRMALSEAKLLYKFTQQSPKELFGSEGNPEKLQAMVWVARHRAGIRPNKYSEIDFDLSELEITAVDADGNPITDEPAEGGDGEGNGDSAGTTSTDGSART